MFGEDKYFLRMKLSEVLQQDDVVAIKAGVVCLLPYPDLHGRQIIYLEPRRHTLEGYRSENMVRSVELWRVFVARSPRASSHAVPPSS